MGRCGRDEEDDLIARERERMTMAWIRPGSDLESFTHAYLLLLPYGQLRGKKIIWIGLEGELQ